MPQPAMGSDKVADSGAAVVEVDDEERINVGDLLLFVAGVLGPVLIGLGAFLISKMGPAFVFMIVLGFSFWVMPAAVALGGRVAHYLDNVMSEEDFKKYLRELQAAKPVIQWSVSNSTYHRYKIHGETRIDYNHYDHKPTVWKQYDLRGVLDETLSPEQTIAMFHLLYDGQEDQEGHAMRV